MTETLLMTIWWPGIREDVVQYIKRCPECQSRETPRRVPYPIGVFPEVLGPGRAWSIDFVVDLPRTEANNKNMIVAVDRFSKYVVIQAVEDKKGSTVANFILTRICYQFGFPEYVLTDQGAEFENELNRSLYSVTHTYKAMTTPYHPACNGQVERFNRSIKNSLAKLCSAADHRDWDRVVDAVAFGLNTTIHMTTGMTPFYLHFGREARGDLAHLIPDVKINIKGREARDNIALYMEEIRQAQRIAQDNIDRVTAIYNKPKAVVTAYRRADRLPPEYEVDDLVLVFTPRIESRLLGDDARPVASRSLTKNWRGPYIVTEKHANGVNYTIAKLDKSSPYVIHANRLKIFVPEQFERQHRLVSQSEPADQLDLGTHA